MKIWNKNIKTSNSSIDTFLSGEDIVLDQELFLYDIEASIAHAEELKAINILNASELKKMLSALKKLAKLFASNKFKLTKKYEDCHSAIEDFLTKELGDLGKKNSHWQKPKRSSISCHATLCQRSSSGNSSIKP